jgi:hypothetical protein
VGLLCQFSRIGSATPDWHCASVQGRRKGGLHCQSSAEVTNAIESADANRLLREHAGLRHGCAVMATHAAFQYLETASVSLAVCLKEADATTPSP